MRLTKVKLTRSEHESVEFLLPPWEVAVLQIVHEDKAEVLEEGVLLDREYPTAEIEFSRLEARYKADTQTGVPFVALAYGQGRLGVLKLRDAINAEEKLEFEAAPTVSVEPSAPANETPLTDEMFETIDE
jgi:hypothetical protein